jgi:hypothetical protein
VPSVSGTGQRPAPPGVANAPLSYFKSVSLWKTPVATCDNGQPDCVPYSQWQQAWTTQVTQ